MALEYLDKLGKAKDRLKNIADTPVGEVLYQFANDSIQKMRAIAPTSSGKLKTSLIWQPVNEEGKQGIDFIADDYWDYVNSGVDGISQSAGALPNKYGTTYSFSQPAKTSSVGMSFKQSISTWIIERGIKAEDNDYDGLAFVIMQSIKRKGIKPRPFVNNVLNEKTFAELEKSIADAFLKMV